jgi:hypothetical protein
MWSVIVAYLMSVSLPSVIYLNVAAPKFFYLLLDVILWSQL